VNCERDRRARRARIAAALLRGWRSRTVSSGNRGNADFATDEREAVVVIVSSFELPNAGLVWLQSRETSGNRVRIDAA